MTKDEYYNSARCSWGIHDYRTKKISSEMGPQIFGHGPDPIYTKEETCDRCGLSRRVVKFKPFRRIKR